MKPAEYSHLGPGAFTYTHYCRAQDDASLNPLRFIEGLAQRLAARHEPYRRALAAVQHSALQIVVEQYVGVVAGGQVTGVHIDKLDVHVHALAARDVYDRDRKAAGGARDGAEAAMPCQAARRTSTLGWS